MKKKTALVITPYQTNFNNFLKLTIGELVKIEDREVNPEWLGWIYCINQHGTSGWVSKNYLSVQDKTAVVIKSYDGTELSVNSGEKIEIFFEEYGWYWSQNQQGACGWLPCKNVILDLEEIPSCGFKKKSPP